MKLEHVINHAGMSDSADVVLSHARKSSLDLGSSHILIIASRVGISDAFADPIHLLCIVSMQHMQI